MSRALARRLSKLEAMKEPPPVEMTDQEVVHRVTAILNSTDESDTEFREWIVQQVGGGNPGRNSRD